MVHSGAIEPTSADKNTQHRGAPARALRRRSPRQLNPSLQTSINRLSTPKQLLLKAQAFSQPQPGQSSGAQKYADG